ncbi:MAG: HAD hydrolase-like protein [Bacteroidota bacterium]
MTEPSIKVAIFDLAGTTVKHKEEVHNCFMEAFAQEGIAITYNDANEAMGKPKDVAISEILEARSQPQDLVVKIHQSFKQKMIDYYRESEEVEEKDGASELFRWLRSQQIKVGIDTGFDRPTADTLMEALGWYREELIDISVTSDEVAQGRPYPDMILRVMSQLGITDSTHVMKVGDTPVDLLEGDHAKVKYNVGVTTGAFGAEELESFPHTHLIADLEEIKSLLHS